MTESDYLMKASNEDFSTDNKTEKPQNLVPETKDWRDSEMPESQALQFIAALGQLHLTSGPMDVIESEENREFLDAL